jgi:hypothetical protein
MQDRKVYAGFLVNVVGAWRRWRTFVRLQISAVVLVLGLTLMLAVAKDKNQLRDWKTGTIVAIEQGVSDHSPGISAAIQSGVRG